MAEQRIAELTQRMQTLEIQNGQLQQQLGEAQVAARRDHADAREAETAAQQAQQAQAETQRSNIARARQVQTAAQQPLLTGGNRDRRWTYNRETEELRVTWVRHYYDMFEGRPVEWTCQVVNTTNETVEEIWTWQHLQLPMDRSKR